MVTAPKLTPYARGIIAHIEFGRISIADATRLLGCHRKQLERILANMQIDAPAAKRAYLASVQRKAEWWGSRPSIVYRQDKRRRAP